VPIKLCGWLPGRVGIFVEDKPSFPFIVFLTLKAIFDRTGYVLGGRICRAECAFGVGEGNE